VVSDIRFSFDRKAILDLRIANGPIIRRRVNAAFPAHSSCHGAPAGIAAGHSAGHETRDRLFDRPALPIPGLSIAIEETLNNLALTVLAGMDEHGRSRQGQAGGADEASC
jgi:hypothetical protein